MKLNRKGFTLIELLIVIVIIGILVAVLIAVINPARARNRAKDAGIEAAMSKISLSVQGYMSAYGNVPDCADLFASIDGETDTGDHYSSTPPYCTFKMPSVSPETFTYTTGTYNNADGDTVDRFWLATKSMGLANDTFVMTSHEDYSGIMFACPGVVTAPDNTTLGGCENLTQQ
jgi:prepilin-type N-terminal cleavage/methylation domain-containing protein